MKRSFKRKITLIGYYEFDLRRIPFYYEIILAAQVKMILSMLLPITDHEYSHYHYSDLEETKFSRASDAIGPYNPS